jgi:hypothetical protein
MTDFTEAALNEATVRCSDGSEWFISLVPAGEDGWIDPVICGHDLGGVYIHWDVNGRALCAGDTDIVEIAG